jgi:hypothetical protein
MLSLERLRHDDRFGAWLTGIDLPCPEATANQPG